MKLPMDQEQEIIKCIHCSKFFVSKAYLKKHYDKVHPDKDYYKDFADVEFLKKGKEEKEASPAKN